MPLGTFLRVVISLVNIFKVTFGGTFRGTFGGIFGRPFGGAFKRHALGYISRF